jgi:hypothetical protein
MKYCSCCGEREVDFVREPMMERDGSNSKDFWERCGPCADAGCITKCVRPRCYICKEAGAVTSAGAHTICLEEEKRG